jgi:hypothetical protein
VTSDLLEQSAAIEVQTLTSLVEAWASQEIDHVKSLSWMEGNVVRTLLLSVAGVARRPLA